MSLGNTRPASHAGSWYTGDAAVLRATLEENLGLVPNDIEGKNLPVAGARVIIAPHAGYDYSGKCAAWAFKCLDLSKAKRVFILGPSHTYGLAGMAVTTFTTYATPLGDLVVDREMIKEIKEKGGLQDIPPRRDIQEHSLEMHLPYLYLRLCQTFGADKADSFPPIVPVLVGDGSKLEEKAEGELLAPYLDDPENAFIVSSDFCHWGSQFHRYMPYSETAEVENLGFLRSSSSKATGKPIYETIDMLDHRAMDAIETGKYDNFADELHKTENTVCGRHPIGVTMAGLEALANKKGTVEEGAYKFKFVRYERSSQVRKADESSVSYASAYAFT